MEEKELISLAKNGDLESFNQLILKYQNLAFTVAFRMMGNQQAAEDICQDSFIKAYQKIMLFKGGLFKSWLMRIITNTAIDQIRKNKKQNELDIYPQDENDNEIENARWMLDSSMSPEEQTIQNQLNKAIQNCINKLPPNFKAVIVLIDLQSFDYKEASKSLDTPLGTIKSRLLRARKKLQNCLLGYEELLPTNFRLNHERQSK